jgi:DNA polymerase-4
MGEVVDAVEAPAALFESAEARTLKTEKAIDALRLKFGKAAVVAGRALK